jgi:hypothetical protein
MIKNEISSEEKVGNMADYIGFGLLQVAANLCSMQELKPDIFEKVAKTVGLSSHQAHTLVRISRHFRDVPQERLETVGWSKLQIIGRYLTEDNAEHLLQLAEKNAVFDLESRLRGEPPIRLARVLTFYFSSQDYERVRAKLIKHGAVVSGYSLLKKEAALMALIRKK